VYNLSVSFTPKERARYNIFDQQFVKARNDLTRMNYASKNAKYYPSIFEMANKLKDEDTPEGIASRKF